MICRLICINVCKQSLNVVIIYIQSLSQLHVLALFSLGMMPRMDVHDLSVATCTDLFEIAWQHFETVSPPCENVLSTSVKTAID